MGPRLWDRLRDWVVVGVLLLVSLVVLLNKNEPVVRQFRAFALDGTARIESMLSWAGTFVRAASENEALRATNIELASELAQRREAEIENAQHVDRDLEEPLEVRRLSVRIDIHFGPSRLHSLGVRTSSTISGSRRPSPTSSRATVTGSVKRLGPALPGLR